MPTAAVHSTRAGASSPPDIAAQRTAAELRYDGAIPADLRAHLSRPLKAAEIRGLLRQNVGALRGWRDAGKGDWPVADQIVRQVRQNWRAYRREMAVEHAASRAAHRTVAIETARRRVRDCLGALRQIQVGPLRGRAFQAAAVEAGLDRALFRYRALQSIDLERLADQGGSR
ncbi:MAG: hypothetical protein WDO24_05765 [Pseudomonadota bacterium]